MAGWREAAGEDGAPDADATVQRFVAGARLLHWAHAIPFLLLLLTGLSLFIPPVRAVHVGGYRLVPLIHVVVGLAFILSPLPLYLALRDRSQVNADLRRLLRLEPADRAWARYALGIALGARLRQPPTGKFNLGQKANTAFTGVVTAGLMGTGAVLAVNYFTKRVFSAGFVEQVFPLHDLFMLIAIPVLAGHIYLGGINAATRESFRGITRGRVSLRWARAHHSRWVDELRSGE